MLLTLSMGHNSNLKFKTNKDLVNYLQRNNFLGSNNVQSVFERYPRHKFMSLDENTPPGFELTPEPVNLKPGVDLSSSMMQSIILSICEIVFMVEDKSKTSINAIVDVGCANGFLSFGVSDILNNYNFEKRPSIVGIDLDEDAIKNAIYLQSEVYAEKSIKFIPLSFEDLNNSSRLGIKNNDFIIFGFALEKSDLIAKLY